MPAADQTTDPDPRSDSAPRPDSLPLPLTELRAGDRGRLHATRLVEDDRAMLQALGMAENCRFRVCKAGDPWIVQVHGTRVGMAPAVASQLLVVPDAPARR